MKIINNSTYKNFYEYKNSLSYCTTSSFEEKADGKATTTFFNGIENNTQKKVIIKRFNKRLDRFNEFKVETSVLNEIRGDNIIEPIAIFDEEYYGYIVLPFEEGGDLFDIVSNSIVFNNSQLITFAYSIVSSLNKLHSKGIIYRDIKLENIVLKRKIEEVLFNMDSNDFILIDFGSCYVESESCSLSEFRGTDLYRPPEYTFHRRVSEKYDIFSLGILLYYLAVGFLPFNPDEAYSEEDLYYIYSSKYIDETFEEPEWEGISSEIKNLIKSMILFDENLRPDADEILKNDLFATLRSPYEFINDTNSEGINGYM